MSDAPSRPPRRWLFVLPLLLGVAVLALVIRSRTAPEQADVSETARPVRVLAAPVLTVTPRAVGFGQVQPGTVWEAVAQVGGQITYRHPRLRNGEIIRAGEVLLRIDPADYELAVAQAEAALAAVEAQLAELEARQSNTRASLEIESQALDLARKELQRKSRLVTQGTVTQSAFEQEQRAVLAQRQSLRNLQNSLALFPAQRRLLEAERRQRQSQLERARLDRERTVLTAPMDSRVAQANVEPRQFVRQGEVMAVLDGIAVSEVTARIPVGRMRTLIPVQPGFPLASLNAETVREVLQLDATVRLEAQDFAATWEARFDRLSDLVDPQTRTVGVIVAVDDSYRKSRPGIRPPLIKGMFVAVELRGKPRPDTLVLPASALHPGDVVYVLDEENRLTRRPVQLGLEQAGFVTVEDGLQPGEQVVISDLTPAVEGLLLEPREDPEALAALEAAVE